MDISSITTGTVFFIIFFLMTTPVAAVPGDNAAPLSDREIDMRLNAATQALYSQKTNADYWEYGWGAFDGGTIIWSAAQAATEQDHRTRNADIVQAVESVVGLTDIIFRPLPAFTASLTCPEPFLTEQDRLACLMAKETLLERSAERSAEPYEMLPHLGNAGFNLLAGLLVWRLDRAGTALTTGISGEVIGEIQLWTTPSNPRSDLDHYKIQFSPLLIPTDRIRSPATGLMISLRF